MIDWVGRKCGSAFEPGVSGLLVTAPPSVCVPDVIGVLTVWIQNQKNQKSEQADSVLSQDFEVCEQTRIL